MLIVDIQTYGLKLKNLLTLGALLSLSLFYPKGLRNRWIGVLGEYVKNRSKVLLSNVYAPNDVERKKTVCRHLIKFMDKFDMHIRLCGDFNTVRTCSERRGNVFQYLIVVVVTNLMLLLRKLVLLIPKWRANSLHGMVHNRRRTG